MARDISLKTHIPQDVLIFSNVKHNPYKSPSNDINTSDNGGGFAEIRMDTKIDKDYVFLFVMSHSLCEIDTAIVPKTAESLVNIVFFLIWYLLMLYFGWIFNLVFEILYYIPIVGPIVWQFWDLFNTLILLWLAYPDFSNSRYLINEGLCLFEALANKGFKKAGEYIFDNGLGTIPGFGPIMTLLHGIVDAMVNAIGERSFGPLLVPFIGLSSYIGGLVSQEKHLTGAI